MWLVDYFKKVKKLIASLPLKMTVKTTKLASLNLSNKNKNSNQNIFLLLN